MLQSREREQVFLLFVYCLEGNINYPNRMINTSGSLHMMFSVVNDDTVVVCILRFLNLFNMVQAGACRGECHGQRCAVYVWSQLWGCAG